MIDKQLLDKRYKKTQEYLLNPKTGGPPIYRVRAFPLIDKVLGRQYKWINKTPEEYYGKDKRAIQTAIQVFRFTPDTPFKKVKLLYKKLAYGNPQNNIPGLHPDRGGHPSAFIILEYGYRLFEEAYHNELEINRTNEQK